MIADFAEMRIATQKQDINQFLSICVYVKEIANGINYIQGSDNEL